MVFVVELLLTSIVVMLAITAGKILFRNAYSYTQVPLTFESLRRVYFVESTNTLYLSVLIAFILVSTTPVIYLVVPAVVAITYTQPWVWAYTLEAKLVSMVYTIRKVSLKRLLDEGCAVTHWTIGGYIKDIIRSEIASFKAMFKDSVNEVRTFFGLYEPTEELYEIIDQLYEKHSKTFEFAKRGRDKKADAYDDIEELLKAHAAYKFHRDPTVAINKIRRLPIYLVYNENPDVFFKLFVQHTLVFYNFFKTTLLAVTLAVIYFIYTVFFFKVQFLKQLSVWFVIGMLYFWLMSGFNFFVKRYQYGKFTSQIQRFWKRTNTCFWLIEGFLLLLFFYYYLNSSQEPLYMYDYSAINQEFLIPLHVIFINIVLLSVVIYLMYFTLLRINSNAWVQLNLYLVVISVFVFVSFFLETYQFYYIISTFNERLWIFNEEDNLWMIDIENPIFRTKHQYMFVCLIAKYWHFLFIFLSWVFFLIKSFEKRKVTYVLFGANIQNMVILYALNFACYLQWFKWLYRRFFDLPYTWFFTNIDNKALFRIFNEMKLLTCNLLSINEKIYKLSHITHKSLTLWNVDSLAIWKFI